MDSDFFEDSYYYPQVSPQGETVSDDNLSWLIHPTDINQDSIIDHDPTKKVGNLTTVATEDIVIPPPKTNHVLSEA